jgi:hypothetical protein
LIVEFDQIGWFKPLTIRRITKLGDKKFGQKPWRRA